MRLQDLDEAIRRFKAWESIVEESDALDLAPHQVRQAEQQRDNADNLVKARIPEAYQWLIVPTQPSEKEQMRWDVFRLSGQESLAVRAAKKLKKDELLVNVFAGTSLRLQLDRVPLWRGDHVSIKQLADDFARYVYLPRLASPQVLLDAINDGLGLLTWERDSFAYADSFDETSGRYRGLRYGQRLFLAEVGVGVLVKPDAARRQIEVETREDARVPTSSGATTSPTSAFERAVGQRGVDYDREHQKPRRFHGTVDLDPTRVGRDASRVGDEIISHLVGLVGTKVNVTLEIEAEIPDRAPDTVVRTVTENSRTLKFKQQGFEES